MRIARYAKCFYLEPHLNTGELIRWLDILDAQLRSRQN